MRGIIASIRERLPNHIDATIPLEKGTSQYRITAASTLNDSYGSTNGVGGAGGSEMFDVTSGGYFTSGSLRTRKHHAVDIPHGSGRDRRVTRFVWDPMDFFDPTDALLQEVPEDNDVLFMRVQRFLDAADGWVDDGPINIIMPQSSLTVARPLLTLAGTAPDTASTAGEKAPEQAMHFHLPLHSSGFILVNLDAANPLHVSFGVGHPMAVVPAADALAFYDANMSEVLISGAGNNVAFSMVISLQNGP
jgi:hypothetical protein